MTAAVPPPRLATYADIEALPPHVVGEIVGGVLHTQQRPQVRDGVAAGALQALLGSAFQFGRGGSDGWLFIPEPELHFGRDVLVPDIAGWRIARATFHPDDAFITIAPDWVCEVLSTPTECFDRVEKRMVYAREGVGHLWFVKPSEEYVEAFVNTAGLWLVVDTPTGEDEAALPPFEAAPFPLPLLWPLNAPSTPEDGA